MAFHRIKQSKSGKPYYEIIVSRGRGQSQLSMRWYVPDGWSQKAVDRELKKVETDFERKAQNGEIISRAEQKEIDLRKAQETAKLKTVRQYVEGVFMPEKLLSISENTRSLYQHFFDKFIFPGIGDNLLVDVDTAILKKLVLDFNEKGYAHSSQVVLRSLLYSLFEAAFADDIIQANPMLKVKTPAQPKDAKTDSGQPKALTVEELAHVISSAKNEPLKWEAYINLTADTGARRGEICGLQWSDIDWNTGAITIKRNLQYTAEKGVYATTPKNGKTRTVDIGAGTVSLLKALRKEQATSCISQWIFAKERSPEPINPKEVNLYFRAFGKKYGIENFHPHLLRHTSASVALTMGADIVSVSERLGHSSIAMTLKTYSHASNESIRKAGQIVRDALEAAENE